MVIGLIFGGGYLYLSSTPVGALGVFLCIVYGVMIGLFASGIFKVGAQLADRAHAPEAPKP